MIAFLFSLAALVPTLAILSAPFCALQLALCKYCPFRPVRLAPAVLFGGGFLWSWWYMSQGHAWGGIMLILVTFPCTLALIGIGLGWLLWRYAQQHLY